MKKLLFVLALGAFAACNSGKTDTSAADSARIADSLKAAASKDSAAAAANGHYAQSG
jgi:hypothetical protein